MGSNIISIDIITDIIKTAYTGGRYKGEEVGSCLKVESSTLSSYYYFMLENYNETSRKFLNPVQDQNVPFIDMTELLDVISEEVDDFVQLNYTLSVEDFNRIVFLKDRLAKGIPIASYQNIDKLKKAKDSYPQDPNEKIKLKQLNDTKEALQETRAKLWEIINAGWVHKIENILPFGIKLFFDTKNYTFDKKMENFGALLEKNDNVLLKSIESSQIFKIMEKQ